MFLIFLRYSQKQFHVCVRGGGGGGVVGFQGTGSCKMTTFFIRSTTIPIFLALEILSWMAFDEIHSDLDDATV